MDYSDTEPYILSPEVNKLRLEGHFCDAIIKAQDVSFHIHKYILSCCSLYFRSLFSQDSPADNTYRFNVSPEIMQAVIDYFYTGHVLVTHENVDKLLKAAAEFNMEVIQEACWSFLEAHLSPQNCIRISKRREYSHVLRDKAFAFVLDHFDEIANSSEEFLQLSCHDLEKILRQDGLYVSNENIVFEAILRWIAHSPEDRTRHFNRLFLTVRLALLNQNYLEENVQNYELVQNDQVCQALIVRVLDAMPDRSSARPRLPRNLLVCGRITSHDETGIIEVYDMHEESWVPVEENVNEFHLEHGAVFLKDSIYTIGGHKDEKYLCTMSRFDLTTNTWREEPSMNRSRRGVSVTVLDGCIYAMGGYSGTVHLKSVERFDPVTNQWTVIAPMHEARSSAGCTTFDGKVYICGGYNGRELLSTAECYDPSTDQWTPITEMAGSRCGPGVIAYAGRIYVVGGFSNDILTELDTVAAYSPESNEWEAMPSMLTARSHFDIAVLENRLFVVGGDNGALGSAECFDITTGLWSPVPGALSPSFGAVQCFVVPRRIVAAYADLYGHLSSNDESDTDV